MGFSLFASPKFHLLVRAPKAYPTRLSFISRGLITRDFYQKGSGVALHHQVLEEGKSTMTCARSHPQLLNVGLHITSSFNVFYIA
jgi:hypothetical protein